MDIKIRLLCVILYIIYIHKKYIIKITERSLEYPKRAFVEDNTELMLYNISEK